jgi:hypothetical protein
VIITGKIVSDVFGLPVSNAVFFLQTATEKKYLGKSNAFGVFAIAPTYGPGQVVICANGFRPGAFDPDELDETENILINNLGEQLGAPAKVNQWLKFAVAAGITFVVLKALA